jgi:hypothetical protein
MNAILSLIPEIAETKNPICLDRYGLNNLKKMSIGFNNECLQTTGSMV